MANSVWPKSIEPRFDDFIGNIIILYKIFLEMVGFQLSEEDIRHLTEEVTDAKGELSKNDFILHVKVSSVEIILIRVIMMAVVDLANVWQWISCRTRTCSVSLRVSILRATITGMRRSTTSWKNFKFKIGHHISTDNCKFRLFMQTLKKVQVKKAWTLFDKNGDGKLTPQEFRCIFLELAKKELIFVKKVDGIAILRRA